VVLTFIGFNMKPASQFRTLKTPKALFFSLIFIPRLC